jgi:hemoglobin
MIQTAIYEAIGGKEAVAAAVDEFYRRVIADDVLAPYFAQSDLSRLKAHQRAFFTVALGGPGAYTGRAMDAAHAGRYITADAFDRVAVHLAETLAALGVPADLVEQIMSQIAPLRSDVVAA